MNLSQAIRKDIAEKLVAQATKKHATAMGSAARSLRRLWRDTITRALKQNMPYLAEQHWQQLIQDGTVNSLREIEVVRPRLENAGTKHERIGTKTDNVGYVAHWYQGKYQAEKDVQRERYDSVFRAMADGWSAVFTNLSKTQNGSQNYLHLRTAFADLPTAKFLHHIDERHLAEDFVVTDENSAAVAWSRAAWPLVQKSQDLIEKVYKVVHQAAEYHDMVTGLLDNCRTAKQLEDRFPEAAKFLPKPLAKRNEIIPTDVFNKARKMLEDGIPN